jgi:hypothetical protein
MNFAPGGQFGVIAPSQARSWLGAVSTKQHLLDANGASIPAISLSCESLRWTGQSTVPAINAIATGTLSGYVYVNGEFCLVVAGACQVVLN